MLLLDGSYGSALHTALLGALYLCVFLCVLPLLRCFVFPVSMNQLAQVSIAALIDGETE